VSSCPHGTTRLLLDRFSSNFIFKCFFEEQQEYKKHNGYFTRRPIFISFLSRSILLRIRNVSDKFVEKIKTHILCSITRFRNFAFYEIMWKIIAEPAIPQMTIWRMRVACLIPKATDTHSEYVTFSAFPLQQWLHERASVLCYTYTACLVVVNLKYFLCNFCSIANSVGKMIFGSANKSSINCFLSEYDAVYFVGHHIFGGSCCFHRRFTLSGSTYLQNYTASHSGRQNFSIHHRVHKHT
jgi:hypothetical protein